MSKPARPRIRRASVCAPAPHSSRASTARVLAVRPGQVGEVYGDAGALQLRTVSAAPPPLPASWAARDRQVDYDLPTQYLPAGITGYEDLNAYGSWATTASYGQVWTPRSAPSGGALSHRPLVAT